MNLHLLTNFNTLCFLSRVFSASFNVLEINFHSEMNKVKLTATWTKTFSRFSYYREG